MNYKTIRIFIFILFVQQCSPTHSMGILKKICIVAAVVSAYFSGQQIGYNAGHNTGYDKGSKAISQKDNELKDMVQRLQHCYYRLNIEESYREDELMKELF